MTPYKDDLCKECKEENIVFRFAPAVSKPNDYKVVTLDYFLKIILTGGKETRQLYKVEPPNGSYNATTKNDYFRREFYTEIETYPGIIEFKRYFSRFNLAFNTEEYDKNLTALLDTLESGMEFTKCSTKNLRFIRELYAFLAAFVLNHLCFVAYLQSHMVNFVILAYRRQIKLTTSCSNCYTKNVYDEVTPELTGSETTSMPLYVYNLNFNRFYSNFKHFSTPFNTKMFNTLCPGVMKWKTEKEIDTTDEINPDDIPKVIKDFGRTCVREYEEEQWVKIPAIKTDVLAAFMDATIFPFNYVFLKLSTLRRLQDVALFFYNPYSIPEYDSEYKFTFVANRNDRLALLSYISEKIIKPNEIQFVSVSNSICNKTRNYIYFSYDRIYGTEWLYSNIYYYPYSGLSVNEYKDMMQLAIYNNSISLFTFVNILRSYDPFSIVDEFCLPQPRQNDSIGNTQNPVEYKHFTYKHLLFPDYYAQTFVKEDDLTATTKLFVASVLKNCLKTFLQLYGEGLLGDAILNFSFKDQKRILGNIFAESLLDEYLSYGSIINSFMFMNDLEYLLFKKGINITDCFGRTPLMYLMMSSFIKLDEPVPSSADFIIDHSKNYSSYIPRQRILINKILDYTYSGNYLIQKIQDSDKDNARRSLKTMQDLIEKQLRIPDKFGITPFMIASRFGMVKFLQKFKDMLIQDLKVVDSHGWGCINYAIYSDDNEVFTYLKKLYKKNNLWGENFPLDQGQNILASIPTVNVLNKKAINEIVDLIKISPKFEYKYPFKF